MNVISIVLALLKLANTIMQFAQEQKWIKVGEDRAVAEAARGLFLRTEHAREIDARVDKLSEDEADQLLLRLGDSGGVRDVKSSQPPKG